MGAQQSFNSQQIIDKYLKQRLFGKNEYMESEEMDILSVNDVTFMLTQCETSNGIVTAATDMIATPITSREIRAIHEQKDAELARSIMENERNNARRQRQVMFGRGLQATINSDPF